MSLEGIIKQSGLIIPKRSNIFVNKLLCGFYKLSTDPSSNYVLTSDSSGNGTWTNNASSRLTVSNPITKGGVTLGLGYNATNLKLTGNNLNTIQDIKQTSTPTFFNTTLTTNLSTAPNNLYSTTFTFDPAITAGVSKHNTLGYDILVYISYNISPTTSCTIVGGVGSAPSPNRNTIVQDFTDPTIWTFPLYVPDGWYMVVDNVGSTTVSPTVSCIAFAV